MGSNASVVTIIESSISIPKDIIVFFVGISCPPTWERVSELEGRLPIGAGGVLGALLGDSLDRVDTLHKHDMEDHNHDWSSTATTQAYNGLCKVNTGVSNLNAACLHTHPIAAGTSTIAGSGTETDGIEDLKNIYGGVFCRKL